MAEYDADLPEPLIGHEIAAFLAATASALSETVTLLEQTAERITADILNRGSDAGRDLIMTIQDFDRMQQEFALVVEILVKAALKPESSWRRSKGGGHPAQDIVSSISLAALKERMLRYLDASDLVSRGMTAEDEIEF